MGGLGNGGDVLGRHIREERFVAGAYYPVWAEEILQPADFVLNLVRRSVDEKLLGIDAPEKSNLSSELSRKTLGVHIFCTSLQRMEAVDACLNQSGNHPIN